MIENDYFDPDEFFLPHSMDDEFMYRVVSFREEIDTPVIVAESNMPKDKEIALYGRIQHGENSNHYENIALDIVMPYSQEPLFDQFIAASRYFTGVGIYPNWKYKGKIVGGLHVEWEYDRERIAYWLGVKEHGKHVYYGVTQHVLKKYKLI